MISNINFVLDNYRVEVAVDSEAAQNVAGLEQSVSSLTNPREILSAIESVSGVQSTVIRNLEDNQIVLSSGLMTPSEE
jgi:hypothetical protein